MSSSNLTASAHTSLQGSYAQNLGYAARAFIAALLAVKHDEPVAPPADNTLSERDRMNSVLELNRLANRYDSTMPNQAAELRHLAVHC